jgi:NADH-quinone oxidoreductase subunit G
MAIIHVDGQPFEVDPKTHLLQACLSLGFDLPYFCWHPAMGSVGACRQCAVKQFKDEHDTRGRIVMACMTAAANGTRIAIEDPEARAFRASVIEWLMINHPHDCPVCEEGGECHLQDMTLMTGHTYRRYRFEKRTHRNQYLGPFINHEMNRCIACYRCVRFYREYAGGDDLDVFAAHQHVYFGRHQDGVLENEFSGNLVEVCPTGVFTDKTLGRYYTRKWDLQTAPSLCVHCALGCNTTPGERYGRLRRIVNRYHGEINGYFLCDRGRFGYDFVNLPGRIREPLLCRDGKLEPVSKEQALDHLRSLLGKKARVIGIGSPRASLEANFALRVLVGAERFYSGMSAADHRLVSLILEVLRSGPARAASVRDAEQADAVLLLGEDVTNTAPRLALSLRQAVRNKSLQIADKLQIPRWQDAAVREATRDVKSPLFIATPDATRLDDVAIRTFHGAPDDLARLGFAVAHALDPSAPEITDVSEEMRALAQEVATALREAEHPLVVSGTGVSSEAVIQAAANVAWALCRDSRTAELCLTVPECNSLGLGLIGGLDLEAALKTLKDGAADTVIVLENDLYRRAERVIVDAALKAVQHIIVIDHLRHDTAARAEVVLPAGTFAETDGTLVSNEGRAQRFYQVYVPEGDIQESWRWLSDMMRLIGRSVSWQGLDEVTRACAATFPALEGIVRAAPSVGFRVAGMRIPREPHRYSGRTAMSAHRNVHEPRPPQDRDSPLAFSMEGYQGRQLPAALIPYAWAPAWNSGQSINKFQDEIGGPLHGGDPGIRLVEPGREKKIDFAGIPPAFQARDEEWLIIPLWHIFGSEELSALAPAVVERVPAPYLALSPDDAARLGIAAGESVELWLADSSYRLPVSLRPALARGVAGLPAGLPGLQGMVTLPAWGKVKIPPSPPLQKGGEHSGGAG